MKNHYYAWILILLCLIVISSKSQAQTAIPDAMGRPLPATTFTYTEGSPFFADEWNKGSVKLADGATFTDVQLKYNELNGALYFKNGSGKELSFTQPVQEFMLSVLKNDTLKQHRFRNGYTASNDPNMFYEVLCDGPVQLLKINLKMAQESKEYNSETATHRIIASTQYFLLIAGRMVAMKKDRKFIYQNLGNKTKEMDAFFTANKLNIKNDNDIIKLINYYNSI